MTADLYAHLEADGGEGCARHGRRPESLGGQIGGHVIGAREPRGRNHVIYLEKMEPAMGLEPATC